MFDPSDFRLEGAVALVTGAGAGIGRAIARMPPLFGADPAECAYLAAPPDPSQSNQRAALALRLRAYMMFPTASPAASSL